MMLNDVNSIYFWVWTLYLCCFKSLYFCCRTHHQKPSVFPEGLRCLPGPRPCPFWAPYQCGATDSTPNGTAVIGEMLPQDVEDHLRWFFFGGPRFHQFHPIITVEWTVWCEGSGCSMVWRPKRAQFAQISRTHLLSFHRDHIRKEKGTSSCCWLDTSVAMEFSPAKNQQHLRPGVSTTLNTIGGA